MSSLRYLVAPVVLVGRGSGGRELSGASRRRSNRGGVLRSREGEAVIQIGLRESRDSAELIHAVETSDIDVTFIDTGPYQTGPLEVRPLLDDPMVFLAPAAAPEAGQPAVSIADIAHLPMIGTRNPGCRQLIDAFRQAPVSPTYVFRSDDNPTIQGLIGSGLAYAVLPLLTVDEHDPTWPSSPSGPSPRPAGSGSPGTPTAGRRRPFHPLSRWRPRSAATSASSGRRRRPREPAGHATPSPPRRLSAPQALDPLIRLPKPPPPWAWATSP
jgi:hypothetical protein